MTQTMTQQSTKDILNDSRLSNPAYQKALLLAQLAYEIEKRNEPNVRIIF
jgi:hypothetical protein